MRIAGSRRARDPRRVRRIVIGLALVTLVTGAGGGGWTRAAAAPALRMTVSPRFGPSPTEVRVQAIIEPARENDALKVVIDSGTYYRSSAIALEGASAPRVHVATFRSVPAGEHEVSVLLVDRRGGVRAAVREYIRLYD